MSEKEKKPSSYAEAYEELQAIVAQLQADDADVDNLSSRIARAGELIRYCREKLRATESDLDELRKESE